MILRSCIAAAAFSLGACVAPGAQNMADAGAVTQVPQATAATADDTAQGASAETDRTDGDRVICKRTIITGSRFKKRVCMTWREWQAISDQSTGLAENIQRRGVQTGDPLGGN